MAKIIDDEEPIMPAKKSAEETAVSMKPSDLSNLIATAVRTAVEEAKKPYVSPAEEAAVAQAQEERRQNAELVKQQAENKKAMQQACTHTRRDGSCRAVFVNDVFGGYLLCQKCQGVVRPGVKPADFKGPDCIWNTDLFNRLFQQAQPSGVIID